MVEDNKYQKEGLELYKRVEKAEKAYIDAINILLHLEKRENRELVVKAISKSVTLLGFQNIDESCFKGAYLLQNSKISLEREYGIRFYPFTIVIPDDKWKKYFEKVLPTLGGEGGMSMETNRDVYPFNALYRISLVSESSKESAVHEEIHQSTAIYKDITMKKLEEEVIKELGRAENIETVRMLIKMMINKLMVWEISAHRSGVKNGEMSWEDVSKGLVGQYLPNVLIPIYILVFQKWGEEAMHKVRDVVFEFPPLIMNACETMKYLQKHFSEGVITHILLNCESLDDIIQWSNVPRDEIEKIIKEGRKQEFIRSKENTDAAKELGKELDELKKEEEVESKEVAREIGKELEGLEKEEEKTMKKRARKIGEELDEL